MIFRGKGRGISRRRQRLKSKGLRWGNGSLILFLLPRRDQLSLTTGEGVVDFRGSHDFRGERKGNQSSPTEVKRGGGRGKCRN